MKNRLLIAGLIIIAAFMLAPLSSVMATDQTPPLTVSESQNVWTVDLLHPIDYGYSGKDVISVKAEYALVVDSVVYYYEINILKTSFTDVQIKLWLDPAGLPEHCDASWVTVTFFDGVVKAVHGPGWTFRTR